MFDRFNAWATALVLNAKDEKGQTFVEYALVLAVIVVALLAAMTLTGLKTAISGAMADVVKAFDTTP
jgi:Flp pilus assembly pilin Flp